MKNIIDYLEKEQVDQVLTALSVTARMTTVRRRCCAARRTSQRVAHHHATRHRTQ
ncbi:MAG TPA: hypothetical protein VEF35_00835 [Candidatus Bathyarchaeia archaeon]|nr:hypothetical protein [Candidatus Bathyarchaeia archaeon]